MSFLKVHDELFDLLYEHSQINTEFRFRPRKTNRSNRLEEGYWFLGNDDYLAVGFWTGDDWRTKIPNISLMINTEKKAWLHFSSTDTDEKFNFIINKVLPTMVTKDNFEKLFRKDGGRYNIYIEGNSLKERVYNFLTIHYPFIEQVVRNNQSKSGGIKIIDDSVFMKDIRKILYYREQFDNHEDDLKNIRPSKIVGFKIENYGSIEKLIFKEIPLKSQWVFLTGENGVGKSSILRALASTIGFRRLNTYETNKPKDFKCTIYTDSDSAVNIDYTRIANYKTGRRNPLLLGFAAYGPFRLNPIFGGLTTTQLKKARSKNGHSLTLFSNDAFLLDLESQFIEWKKSENRNDAFESRKYAIKQFLEGILLNVGDVEFSYDMNGLPLTIFREKDGDNNLFEPVGITELSSGYMSIISMMSDLLVRLYRQQPDIDDPGELKGVVFIDEIDIHLHPKFQKHFVEQLTAAFPKVQFIVTTHSPIPLLGAPKNSVIGVVKRTVNMGTYIERLDDKVMFDRILPNTILNSPIFGMEDLVPDSKEKEVDLILENEFSEALLYTKLEDDVKSFMNNDKIKELIDVFKSKEE